jgi:hypothetical protein
MGETSRTVKAVPRLVWKSVECQIPSLIFRGPDYFPLSVSATQWCKQLTSRGWNDREEELNTDAFCLTIENSQHAGEGRNLNPYLHGTDFSHS